MRGVICAYLILQALACASWWLLLVLAPASRAYFKPSDAADAVLLAFMPADLVLYTGTALVAAVGIGNRRRWGLAALCLHAGAAAYAALYCVVIWILTRSAGWSAILMLPSLLITPIFCARVALESADPIERVKNPHGTAEC